jgi:hypothetical protein
METAIATPRCVVIVNSELAPGRAANAAAVLALTVGQRHPWLVGGALVDGSGFQHPGLIPIGIAVLAAGAGELAALRGKAIAAGCDVVDFPAQGQQTTDYAAFQKAVLEVPTDDLSYVGVALVGEKKAVGKIVANLALLK